MANLPARTVDSVPSEHLADHMELRARHNLYDAKGDILIGTVDDEVDRLAVGADGMSLQADSSNRLGVRWDLPALARVLDMKGDLIVGTADNVGARLPAALTDGYALVTDSSQPLGLRWSPNAGLAMVYRGAWQAFTGAAVQTWDFADGLVPAGFSGSPTAPTIQNDGPNATYTKSLQTPVVSHSQVGYAEITITVPAGGAPLDFWRRIESEGGYDVGRFYIDGVAQYAESGFTGWSFKGPFNLAAGNRVLRWDLSHDGSVLSGFNAQRIAGLRLVPPITGMQYVANDVVSYDGKIWVALRANSNVQPTEGPDWAQIGIAALPAWTALTLAGTWTAYDPVAGTFAPPGYYRAAEGVVRLRGQVKGGTIAGGTSTIGTLPAGFRPAFQRVFMQYGKTATTDPVPMRVDVQADGVILLTTPTSPTQLSLDGLSFRAS